MKKFWNWIRNEDGERILRLEGPIDEDSFWGDEITPDAFREELEAEEGDVTVWLNSPGGNVFAAASIYNMLCDHKGKVTVKIDAIAASAASVVAMAGDRVLMSPVALLMLHDPMTIAMGNAQDMEKAITTLNEVKESIINAYVRKTGMSRNRVSKMMSDETWLNAKKAVDYHNDTYWRSYNHGQHERVVGKSAFWDENLCRNSALWHFHSVHIHEGHDRYGHG